MTRQKNKNDVSSDLLDRKCDRCNGDVYLNEKSLSCSFCKKLFHHDCLHLDRKEYEKLRKIPVWFCKEACKSSYDDEMAKELDKVPENPTNRDIISEIRDLRKSFTFVSDNCDDVKKLLRI